MLFETGGTGDGTVLLLRDADSDGTFDDLTFLVKDSSVNAVLTVDLTDFTGLSPAQLTEEFLQIVAVFDRDAAGNADKLHIFVNGVEAVAGVGNTTLATTGDQSNLNDWSGSNAAGLGQANSSNAATAVLGGSDASYTPLRRPDIPFSDVRQHRA